MIKGKYILLASMLVSCAETMAQDQPEYRMEIGGGVGLTSYVGDFNSRLMAGRNTAPSFGVVARRVFNPYSALRLALTYSTIKGKSMDSDEFYPDINTSEYGESDRSEYEFKNPMVDLEARYEYNFQPYGTGRDYRGAKRLTPFISIGFGLNYVNTKAGIADYSQAKTGITDNAFGVTPFNSSTTSVFTCNMPVGLGVKYKLGDRTNLALEWMMHFSLSDKLDGVKDPYRITTNGLFKNTDCYSTLQFTVTYSFWEKCRTCHKG